MLTRVRLAAASCVLVLLFASMLTSCSKRCDTALGCQRACSCTDKDEGVTYSCAMTFNCDVETKVCDPMHDKSCEEICQTYVAAGTCGRQCKNDTQCLIRCTCSYDGGATAICEQAFACQKEPGVCEATHALTTCAAICQNCVVGG